MTRMRWLSFLGLLAATVLAASACFGAPREIAVSLQEFSFIPAQIDARPGEKLRFVLKNTGKLPHRFVSEDIRVSKDVEVGKTQSVDAVAPGQAGSYTFSCDVPGHEPAGMRGTLVVK